MFPLELANPVYDRLPVSKSTVVVCPLVTLCVVQLFDVDPAATKGTHAKCKDKKQEKFFHTWRFKFVYKIIKEGSDYLTIVKNY
jgi:hypothetical protein